MTDQNAPHEDEGARHLMGSTPARQYDVWVDFSDVDDLDQVSTYTDLVRPGHGPYGVGAAVTAGDNDGVRCPATVLDVTGKRLVLQLDLDRLHQAGQATQ